MVGATNEPPVIPGLRWFELGMMEWVFAVSPHHPLAKVKNLLDRAIVSDYCVVVVADTSCRPDVGEYGLQGGQPYLAVLPRSKHSVKDWGSVGYRVIVWPACSTPANWSKRK